MTVVEQPHPAQSPDEHPARNHLPVKPGAGQRKDIQALRALAVGAVVLYHLLPHRLTGGFVGVDVFFVVSGFLIGSHLLKESVTTGRVRLGRFWARRARRLLPAALLVLVVVAVVTPVLVPLGQRSDVWRQIMGSAFYVQNWVLAAASVDYLAADDAASPLQHFWTLSVEEQFYVLLPLVLVVVAWKARRRLLTATGVLAVLTGASLAYSLHLTHEVPPAAYFSTFTRAWEFLLGTLLAAAVVGGLRLHRYVRFALGTIGLLLILAAIWRFDGATPFPGYAAALPVVGAMAVIAADGQGPLALAARLRPVTWLGDHSYALYLWHWPLIVLVPLATGHALTRVDKIAVLAASLVVSYASTKLVEDPLRYSAWLAPSGRAGLASAAAMVMVAALAL
ncbi:MAG: acyltransferase, partial [Nocardioides sp.]|nr:acyltransferase [Nocardioides sp.]